MTRKAAARVKHPRRTVLPDWDILTLKVRFGLDLAGEGGTLWDGL